MVKRNMQKGQALLIILLVMAVVLTVALSLVSRSITDISISRKGEEAARAFSAAEAGIEHALKAGGTAVLRGNFTSGDAYSAEPSGIVVGGGTEFVHPSSLLSGESATVWFASHATDGSLAACDVSNPCFTGSKVKVCWGAAGTPSNGGATPAIEVSVLYDDSGAKIARAAYDPNSIRNGAAGNNFTAPDAGSCIVGGQTFAFNKVVDLASLGIPNTVMTGGGLRLARLRLLYNTDAAHPVGIVVGTAVDVSETGKALPGQGTKIVSTGTSGDSTRKIEVFKLYSDLPPVFDFGVFAGAGNLVK